MSSTLRTAVEDLRAALVDEDAGNGHVRDCPFEVVEAWDAAALAELKTHLQDSAQPDGTARCGAVEVVTMSHHEIKRGRITCAECLMAVHDDAC
ncbi:MAG: hypothetical protein OXQ31_22340 [Spirochaetaceae bacterium]|nr:hypothetical protein [Spirochaetaceae bacterium]